MDRKKLKQQIYNLRQKRMKKSTVAKKVEKTAQGSVKLNSISLGSLPKTSLPTRLIAPAKQRVDSPKTVSIVPPSSGCGGCRRKQNANK